MEFEWDGGKSERNRRERGFGYDAAALIFEGPVIEWCDIRESWKETRIVAVGSTGGRILAVIYADWGAVRRIISARRARKKECQLWQSLVNL